MYIKSFLKILKIICLLSLIISNSIFAINYYVDATLGSDTNAGTSPSTAWKTLGRVNKEISPSGIVKAGDAVLFKRGETFIILSGDQNIYGNLWIQKGGITFSDFGSGNRPIIDGENKVLRNGCGVIYIGNTSISDVTIENLHVINPGQSGIRSSSGGASPETEVIRCLFPTNNLTIRNCYLDGGNKATTIMLIASSNNLIIQDCTFENTEIEHGIYLSTNVTNPLIERSTFRNCKMSGIKINTEDLSQTTGAIIRYNTVQDVSVGILDAGADGAEIHDNLIEIKTGTSGAYPIGFQITGKIRAGNSVTRYPPQNGRFYNNTIIMRSADAATQTGIGIWTKDGNSPDSAPASSKVAGRGYTFKNNIVKFYYHNSSSTMFYNQYQRAPSGITLSNNVWHSVSSGTKWEIGVWESPADIYTFAEWQSKGYGVNSVNKDPLFVSADGNYSISANSPAIGLGTTSISNKDINGNQRPQPLGTNPDAGCYEINQLGSNVILPVAAFNASDVTPTTSQIVTFTDASSNSPTSWQWTFSPTSISFVDGTSSTSRNPHVRFNSATTYSCTLRASNAAGSDVEVKTNLISASPDLGINFNVSLFLSGPYENNSMKTTLNSDAFLPKSQPFNLEPWNYSGSEAVPVGFSEDIIDWVLVEVRSDLAASTRVARKAALLKSNGEIADVLVSGISFPNVPAGAYYIVVRHRNHIDIMSSAKVVLGKNPVLYDFTNSQAKALGTNAMKDFGDGNFGLYSGDGNSDGVISIEDIQNKWIPQFLNSVDGYLESDFDMDGSVTASDNNMYWLPNNGAKTNVP